MNSLRNYQINSQGVFTLWRVFLNILGVFAFDWITSKSQSDKYI